MPDNEKLCYSVNEARKLLGINENSMYAMVHSGVIRHIKWGARILIPRRTLEEDIAKLAKMEIAK
jgi:excisionase family DNA binding protein